MPGSLFVVATPIGNLEDLTFRALRTLKEVDLIAAEDTRRTARLLAHYEIRKPLVSLREHNEHKEAPRLTGRLLAGESIALVSDAGTPGIADPGARFVAAAREAGAAVVPIPGPSAITAALSVAGTSADEFVFMGFVPRSGAERDDWMDRLAEEPRTVVFFESPHRIQRTVAETTVRLAKRPIYWFKELTKLHEQLAISPNVTNSFPSNVSGEYVAVAYPVSLEHRQLLEPSQALETFHRLTEVAGFSTEDAIVMAAAVAGSKPAVVRKAIKKQQILAKQQNASRP